MKSTLTTLAIFALLLAPTLAQERQGGLIPMRGDRRAEIPSLGVPLHLSGVVLQTDLARRAIQIQTKENKRVVGFALDPKCAIKADKKQFGKKELTLEEIEAGYQVELTVRQADLHVIEMKVKKPKASPPKGE